MLLGITILRVRNWPALYICFPKKQFIWKKRRIPPGSFPFSLFRAWKIYEGKSMNIFKEK